MAKRVYREHQGGYRPFWQEDGGDETPIVFIENQAIETPLESIETYLGPTSILTVGEKADITTTSAALGGSVACQEVLIQADVDNTANILIGNSTAQYFVLEAGHSISIPASNVNLIYVKSASGTQAANYIAKV